jgi:hypothetical protein
MLRQIYVERIRVGEIIDFYGLSLRLKNPSGRARAPFASLSLTAGILGQLEKRPVYRARIREAGRNIGLEHDSPYGRSNNGCVWIRTGPTEIVFGQNVVRIGILPLSYPIARFFHSLGVRDAWLLSR